MHRALRQSTLLPSWRRSCSWSSRVAAPPTRRDQRRATGLQRTRSRSTSRSRTRTSSPRAPRSRSRPASRSTCTSVRQGRPAARAQLTRAADRRLQGRHHREDARRSTSPASSTSRIHSLDKLDRAARGQLISWAARSLSCWCLPTASAGPRTCPIPLGLAIGAGVAALVVSFLVLVPGLAHTSPPGAHPRPPGAGRGSPGSSTAPASTWTPAGPRTAVLRLPDLGAGRGAGPGHQPGARHLLRAGLGRHRAVLAALRPGRARRQPGPHDQRCCWPG